MLVSVHQMTFKSFFMSFKVDLIPMKKKYIVVTDVDMALQVPTRVNSCYVTCGHLNHQTLQRILTAKPVNHEKNKYF